MSSTEFIISVISPLAIIGCIILFAIWQAVKLQKPSNYAIDPKTITPFEKYTNTEMGWLVARERQWPPIKCGISFRNSWPFIEIKRLKDQCGLVLVYLNNQKLVGKINIYNGYQCYIECLDKEIHAIPDLADFTNICRKVSYILPANGHTILSITPYLDFGQKVEY